MVGELGYFHKCLLHGKINTSLLRWPLHFSLLPPPLLPLFSCLFSLSLILKPKSLGMQGNDMKTDKLTKMVQEPSTADICLYLAQ